MTSPVTPLQRRMVVALLVASVIVLGLSILNAVQYGSLRAAHAREGDAAAQIRGLKREVAGLRRVTIADAAAQAERDTKIDALGAQIRQLGGTPVAQNSTSPTTSTTTTTTTRPPASTTTSSTTTTTTATPVMPPCTVGLKLLGLCH